MYPQQVVKVSVIDCPDEDHLAPVFHNGQVLNLESLDDIRARFLSEIDTIEAQDYLSLQTEV